MKSGKRFILLGVLIGTVLLLSGCMEGSLHITVNGDKSADVVHEMGFDSFFIEMMEEDMSLDELKEEMAGEGYDVSTYEEGNMSGIRAERDFASMEKLNREDFDISLPSGENGESGEEELNVGNISFAEGFFRDHYRIDLLFDMSEGFDQSEMGDLSDTLKEQINFDFVLTLPVKASDHNADEVQDDGYTLVWNLEPGEENQVTMAKSAWNVMNIVITLLIVVAVLGGGVLVYIKSARR